MRQKHQGLELDSCPPTLNEHAPVPPLTAIHHHDDAGDVAVCAGRWCGQCLPVEHAEPQQSVIVLVGIPRHARRSRSPERRAESRYRRLPQVLR